MTVSRNYYLVQGSCLPSTFDYDGPFDEFNPYVVISDYISSIPQRRSCTGF
ncbi:hypothetical protein ACU8KH_03640 [Lachancea thermotolerans]